MALELQAISRKVWSKCIALAPWALSRWPQSGADTRPSRVVRHMCLRSAHTLICSLIYLHLSISLYLSISLSLYLLIFLSLYLSIPQSFYLSISPSLHLSISPSPYLPISPYLSLSLPISPYLSLSLPISPSLSLSLYPSISLYLSISLSLYLSILLSLYLSSYLYTHAHASQIAVAPTTSTAAACPGYAPRRRRTLRSPRDMLCYVTLC